MRFFEYLGGVSALGSKAIAAIFTSRWDLSAIVQQMMAIGNRSVSIVVLIGVFTGMVLALQFTVGHHFQPSQLVTSCSSAQHAYLGQLNRGQLLLGEQMKKQK